MGEVVPFKSQNRFVNFRYFFRKSPPKGDFLEICLTIFFRVGNLGNLSAMRVILFFENIQNLIQLSKMKNQIEKMFSLSEIIASEFAVLNFLY